MYSDNLIKINGNTLSSRELDILACLFSKLPTKKIASLLGVSSSTIETHIRTIMVKTGCHSRKRIIEVIHHSHDIQLLQSRFSLLLLDHDFKFELQSFAKKNGNISCVIFYYDPLQENKLILKTLKTHLSMAGVLITAKSWYSGKKDTFIIKSFKEHEKKFVIYCLSKSFKNRIEELQNNLEVEIDEIICLLKNKDALILLCLDETAPPKKDYKITQCNIVKNYYSSILSLLQLFSPLHAFHQKPVHFNLEQNFIFEPNNQKKHIYPLVSLISNQKAANHILKKIFIFVLSLFIIFTALPFKLAEEKLYDTILWIRAETSDSLNNSYLEFSKCLKIDIKGFKSTDIQHLVHEELKNFNAKNILFVLDNAIPSKYIEDYLNNLNKDFLTPSKLHVLITSRSQKWHKDKLLLDVFTEQEAYTFIKKHLPNEKDDSIYNLAKTLHYFPLAINQAIIYIQAHTNIDTYVELLKPSNNYRKALNNHAHALWSTWNLGFSNLSTKAKSMLIMSSYLDADEINLNYFKNLTLEERDSAIAELKNYSFITINNDQNSFKIHRLLQKIVREHEGTPGYLMKTIKMLDFSFTIYQYVNKDLCDLLMPHVISLAYHAIETPSLFYEGLALYIKAAMYASYVQEDIKLADERWSEILFLSKKHLSTEKGFSYLLASINTHIGFGNYLLGNPTTAEQTLKQAKDTYEKPLVPISLHIESLLKDLRWRNQKSIKDDILSDYAFTLNAIANVEFDLNKISASEENYKQALYIINQCKEQNKTNIYKITYLQNILSLYTYIKDFGKADLVARNLTQIHDEDTSGLS